MSKKNILLIVAMTLIFMGCKKTTSPRAIVNTSTEVTNKITIEGVWARTFSMGNEVNATVTYKIFKDSLQYEMAGPMALNYTIGKDTLINENQWVGKKGDTPYVIFMKDISTKSITLLKMKTKSIEEAIKMKFPSDSARSKFSSWNVYLKK